MKGIWNLVDGLKPTLVMVLVQFGYVGVNLLLKLAINDGMNMRIATAYRLIFASAFTIPVSLIFERNRPKLTGKALSMAFFSGLIGATLFLNLFFEAMALTSATFVIAIFNLIPAITFMMAISCGLERLNLRNATGKAKVLGTLIGIAGAMLLTFLKGVKIDAWSFHINLLHPHQHQHAPSPNRLLGALCAVGSCIAFSLWLIIQAKMNEEYPSHHSSAALMSLMGATQSTVFALCLDRDWSQWKLGWNIRLLTVACSGIAGSGLLIIAIAWCVGRRGPLFASVFNPLLLLLMVTASSIFLDENLYLGSAVGALLIVCGLYLVLWGKSKENRMTTQLVPSAAIQAPEAVEIVLSAPIVEDKSYSTNTLTDIKGVDN